MAKSNQDRGHQGGPLPVDGTFHNPAGVASRAGDTLAAEPTTLGERVRMFRAQLRMEQARLAELAGLGTKQAVSSIERGIREVKAFELARLAAALRVPMDVLLGVTPAAPVAPVLWRRKATIGTDDAAGVAVRRGEHEAQLRERARNYALLEEWCDAVPADDLPDYKVDVRQLSYAKASALAENVREQLGLGSRPADSLEGTLSGRFGVKIFFAPLGHDGEASAACVRDDDEFGCAVLLNSDEAPVRRAFSLAHELFHLVTWSSVSAALLEDAVDGAEPSWYATMERCAQSFSAALLIPAGRVMAELERRATPAAAAGDAARYADRLQPSDYAFIAHDGFKVSADALLWRLVNLNVLTHSERSALAAHPELRMSARSFAPRDDTQPQAFPTRFWDLLLLAYQRGEAGLSRLAAMAEMPAPELYHQLTAGGDDAEFEASIHESAEAAAV